MFSQSTQENLKQFESFAEKELLSFYPSDIANKKLLDSIMYSFKSGGKRFRPAMTLAVSEMLGISLEKVLPWCLALEMIHTYSLIHDDLPCMDNDDFRRGKPTNHKIYGESIALLAGDALLTEAFALLAKHYGHLLTMDSNHQKVSLAAKLIEELAQIAGLRGMIGGQFLDMEAQGFDLKSITQMHNLKTGALISGCFSGPGVLRNLSKVQQLSIKQIGLDIGFLFQVKDDILDAGEKNQEAKSIIPLLGNLKDSEEYIQQKSEEVIGNLKYFLSKLEGENQSPENLVAFINWNRSRDY